MTMREEFEAWCVKTYGPHHLSPVSEFEYDLMFVAYRAGQEAMRERAANIADQYEEGPSAAETIRALPID
jgi:hypothetical protein